MVKLVIWDAIAPIMTSLYYVPISVLDFVDEDLFGNFYLAFSYTCGFW